MKLFKPTTQSNQDGFTVLFAMVVVSIVVLLGTTMTGIFLRSSLLASSSEASSQAFYAADTALECAMYYDRHTDAFATSTSNPDISQVECMGIDASNTDASQTGGGPNRTYTREFDLDSSILCAGVTVFKFTDDDDEPRTRISARGFSSCEDTERQAERALRTGY